MAGARSIPYTLDESQVEFEAVRAQGSGGQNVNKVSNAAHLRFDVQRATLPEALRERLLARADAASAHGIVRIKARNTGASSATAGRRSNGCARCSTPLLHCALRAARPGRLSLRNGAASRASCIAATSRPAAAA